MPASFEIEFLNPADLSAHPLNWAKHGDRQKDALAGSLAEFGWLAAPVYNKRTKRILDGHLRVDHALKIGADAIPVRVVDVDEETERRILATLDRVGELRERDDTALMALLKACAEDSDLPTGWDEVDYGNLSLRLAAQNKEEAVPDFDPTSLDDQGRLDRKAMVICPECSHEFVP